MDQPRFMPLFQIPRFVRLIARRLPVSPCFDQDLRENFRERATSSFSLLDRNFLIHLYICVENCQYIFPNVSIESRILILSPPLIWKVQPSDSQLEFIS